MATAAGRAEAMDRLRPYIERARSFSGWDFTGFDTPRPLDPAPAWDYEALVREMARKATAVLDLGTGGGEFIASIRDGLPRRAVATEEWHVNAPIAHRLLAPLGVAVVRARSLLLPFRDGAFDLVIDLHEELSPAEVARVVRPGGRVVTQQVGPENWRELVRYFPAATEGHRGSRVTDSGNIRGEYAAGFAGAGLTVTRDEQHDYRVAYKSLGDVVFMLLITPWTIPDFDVERDLDALLALEAGCTTHEGLVMTWSRFLIVAQKPLQGEGEHDG